MIIVDVALAAGAGGVGAGLRYVVDTLVSFRARSRFPLGILIVNVTGSAALGLLTPLLGQTGTWAWMLGVGLLGGYTTFSTVSVETVLLAERGARRSAWLNATGTAAACVGGAFAGLLLGGAIAA